MKVKATNGYDLITTYNDFCIWRQCFDCNCDTGYQTTSANRDDNSIDWKWHLFNDFQAYCALTGDDVWVVITVD